MNSRYHQSYRRGGGTSRASKTLLGVGLLALATVLAFGGIVWFRKSADEKVVVDDAGTTLASPEAEQESPTRRSREELLLTDSSGGSQTVVSREIEDHVFRVTVVSHLSDPPEGQFYEGWLLREDPFDFFSTGAMVLNADGTYALIWEGPRGKDFEDFNKVIITRELSDGDPAPSEVHVLEGAFAE